ncbi:hypothetical protein [Chitinophaga nivalis]|uniref:Uncharacterized protein n=1 Tax=Chitinophaga nivalis TaxID=2991709 RepID=A0ABT3INA8_9BACT|nr:hypothetical protein [Chitinophaga nivalis]MCW3464864.1 hypothetical protein [Chitinophaga nivalis]MCW3485445.1 hypothetical protein [Chitinophaga nivalis]
MDFFRKSSDDRLYVSDNAADDKGFIAFVIPAAIAPPGKDTIELKDAWSNTAYAGTFVFSAATPVLSSPADITAFLTAIYNVLGNKNLYRALVWLQDLHIINKDTAPAVGIKADGSALNTSFTALLAPGLALTMDNGMELSWQTGSTPVIVIGNLQDYQYHISFSGNMSPAMRSPIMGTLAFSGSLMGTVQFGAAIQRQALYENMTWGFQLLYTAADGVTLLSSWLPLADYVPDPDDFLGFTINIDPTDVYNEVFNPCTTGTCTISGAYASRRTWFGFSGLNDDNTTTVLSSFYRTVYGTQVQLLPVATGAMPARLVFARGNYALVNEQFIVTPEGDFTPVIAGAKAGQPQFLMGGWQGTEFFSLLPQLTDQPGDTLRFLSGQPAYAPVFPFEMASPVKAPQEPDAPLLDTTYTTAWATVVPGEGNTVAYVAQPKGSALFGVDSFVTDTFTDIFGHVTPGFTVRTNDTVTFPLIPYTGAVFTKNGATFSATQLEDFENTLVSPVRRKYVSKLSGAGTSAAAGRAMLADTNIATATTPSGLLVTTSTTAGVLTWEEVFLGKNTDNGKEYTLKFTRPDDALITALQSGDLMLVVANADYLGTAGGGGNGQGAFYNTMSIGSWEMTAAVGTANRYDDYRNVMIVKGKRGKLFDPDDLINSLTANPSQWTQGAEMASPSVIDREGELMPPDPDQLVILSQWIQNYFLQASLQTDNKYFDQFNTIARSENWTGILFLRMDISKLPENLLGIMAGVTAPDSFNVHHLGIQINPVKKGKGGAVVDNPGDIFGLIYYVDPDFVDDNNPVTIAPTTPAIYDFRLLTLKVLFERTAVSSFESLAQLTMAEILNMPVSAMADQQNVYRNILLSGSFQLNGKSIIYNLSAPGDNTFYFNSNIINKIQVTNVVMSTRNSNNQGMVESWFGLQGMIDFKIVADTTNNTVFDIFSFGNDANSDAPNKGLMFSNLGVRMVFPAADPTLKELNLNTSEITFDTSRSTPRKNCLFLNFALDLQGLLTAAPLSTLQEHGYVSVIPDLAMSDVSDDTWYGLRYRLNLGTPGELAGKLGLNAYLLTAWSPLSTEDNYYRSALGIALPGTGGGAKLISLQTVLNLSIGQIRLTYNDTQKSFLLLFTEIALKFFGLLKVPPNGATVFYLFGNPDAGGKASGLGWYAMYRQNKPALTS